MRCRIEGEGDWACERAQADPDRDHGVITSAARQVDPIDKELVLGLTSCFNGGSGDFPASGPASPQPTSCVAGDLGL